MCVSQRSLDGLYKLRWLQNGLDPGLSSADLARMRALLDEEDPQAVLRLGGEILDTAESFDDLDRELIRLVEELMRNSATRFNGAQ